MQPPYKVLVVGCGAIGAGYDLYTDAVQTHAKAFHLHPLMALALHDRDDAKAREVAKVYDAEVVENLSDDTLARFDVVSICTPTRLHYPLLEQLIRIGTPLVVCEKPVVSTLEEISRLKCLTAQHPRTKILVNYIRRFQPGFAVARTRIEAILREETLRQVIVRYVRGLTNNGGHALDTLNFLTGDSATSLTRPVVQAAAFDAFPDDPTVTLQARWNGVPITFLGFSDTSYSLFEIDLYTESHRIAIEDSGNTIRYFNAAQTSASVLKENSALRQYGVLKDYMHPVAENAIACLEGTRPTNFASALEVNRQLLAISEPLVK